jgi:hypothetical protein
VYWFPAHLNTDKRMPTGVRIKKKFMLTSRSSDRSPWSSTCIWTVAGALRIPIEAVGSATARMLEGFVVVRLAYPVSRASAIPHLCRRLFFHLILFSNPSNPMQEWAAERLLTRGRFGGWYGRRWCTWSASSDEDVDAGGLTVAPGESPAVAAQRRRFVACGG